MANTILTSSIITKEALAVFHQKANFLGNINRSYDSRYAKSGAKIGSTLAIRQPNEFTVRSGATLAAQDVTETSTDLTVSSQKGVDINFSSEELTLHIDEFSDRYIKPAMSALVAVVEADAMSMFKDVYNFYDGVGAADSLANQLQAKKLLSDGLAPTDSRFMLRNTQGTVDFLSDTKGLFNAQAQIAKQYKDGMLGTIGGFDNFENTLVPRHTTGTAVEGDTSYNVNGASQVGSTLVIGTGSTSFLKGDIVTLAGCNRVHPESKTDTGELQRFVVTADSGTSATSLSISPAITVSGGKQNVTASPTTTGAVSKIGGGASATWGESIAFHKDAFAFATADLVKPEGVDFCSQENLDGVSMRVVRAYDINADKFPCRIDMLYGYATLRAAAAARIGINS